MAYRVKAMAQAVKKSSDGLRHTAQVLDHRPKEKTMKKKHPQSSLAGPTLVLGATGKTGRRVTETWRIVA